MSNLNTDAAGYPPTTPTEPSRTGTGTHSGGKMSAVAADAGEATHHVVDTAKSETRSVASEAGRQAKKLAGQVGDELRGQAATQQTRAADALHSAGSSFSRMADASDDDGLAPQLVRAAGDRVDSVATWLGTRDPGAVLEDVKRFARRRPGVFIAIAVGTGLVVGRLARALASGSGDDAPSTPTRAADAPTRSFDAPPVPPIRETVPPTATTVGSPGGVAAGAATIGGSGTRLQPDAGEQP